jgi:hypothetical protein
MSAGGGAVRRTATGWARPHCILETRGLTEAFKSFVAVADVSLRFAAAPTIR